MKIKTITCHDVYNYGASLQALALQSFLEFLGHEVKIINYKPNYLSFHYRLSTYIPNDLYRYKPSLKYGIVRFCFIIYRFFLSFGSIKRKRSFDKFTRSYLHLTKKYKNYDVLSKLELNNIVDIYIAGSDQIWNSLYMENGKDPAFYLTFLPSNVKKIAYAASFGSTSIHPNFKDIVSDWLLGFNAISVREESGLSILKQLNIDSDVVCDPVFLLGKEQWIKYCKHLPQHDYILIYNVGYINYQMVEMAKLLSRKFDLKVYSILDKYLIDEIDDNIINAGPIEFISYINNANYVVTNSFHATAFSMIFNKQFYTYTFTDKSNSSRMTHLLNTIGLMDRYEVDRFDTIVDIDYNIYNDRITNLSSYGRQWLVRIINERNNE